MSATTISKIYHDPKDPGCLGGVERLLRRARQLHVPGVTRKTVQEYLRSEQVYTLHKPVRRRFTKNHSYVTGILSSSPTWPICRVSPGKTVE